MLEVILYVGGSVFITKCIHYRVAYADSSGRNRHLQIHTVAVGAAACLILATGTKGRRFYDATAKAMIQQPKVPSSGLMPAINVLIRSKEVVMLFAVERCTKSSWIKLDRVILSTHVEGDILEGCTAL
uniref:Uncharacterized protein n=1 Tax=Manihot esculenta TaxID=3983 RepID=A0A2C9V6R2_MANES